MNKRGNNGEGGGEIDSVLGMAEIANMIVTRSWEGGDLLGEREREREIGVKHEAEYVVYNLYKTLYYLYVITILESKSNKDVLFQQMWYSAQMKMICDWLVGKAGILLHPFQISALLNIVMVCSKSLFSNDEHCSKNITSRYSFIK